MVERPMPPILAFNKVSKRFGAVIVAQAIDLTVADGEALGIIGPNGAGKTTLFGIASGTVWPDAGRVVFAGSDITRLHCTWHESITMFTDHLPWLKGRDLELVMGGGLANWIRWP